MNSLLSYEFLFGALMLCAFQVQKFSEIDDDLNEEVALPNLRASDFLSHVSYVAVLVMFVAATLLGYAMLCRAAPSMVSWIQVTGGGAEAAAAAQIAPSTYPLWIAAAFMGLAHQAIPGLKNVANLQRKFFHALIGVPRYVVETASYFSRQILDEAISPEAMAQRLGELCGRRWRGEIESIADIGFFESELRHLELDDDQGAPAASPRLLKTWIRQVVYIACIATMRKSGPRGLAELADKLRVKPTRESRPLADLTLPALGSISVLAVLLFLVPMLADPVAWLVGASGDQMFWPNDNALKPGDDGPIMQSAVYLLGQVLPVLIAAGILASTPLRRVEASAGARARPEGALVENAGTYLVIGVVVFMYGGALTLWDYGRHHFYKFDGLWPALEDQAPYFLLQSLIAVAICIAIQKCSAQNLMASRERRMMDGLLVVVVAAAASAFYASARLKYAFLPPRTADFILLVVILNAVAAAIAFVGCQSVWRRRQIREELRGAFPMPTALAPALGPDVGPGTVAAGD